MFLLSTIGRFSKNVYIMSFTVRKTSKFIQDLKTIFNAYSLFNIYEFTQKKKKKEIK